MLAESVAEWWNGISEKMKINNNFGWYTAVSNEQMHRVFQEYLPIS